MKRPLELGLAVLATLCLISCAVAPRQPTDSSASTSTPTESAMQPAPLTASAPVTSDSQTAPDVTATGQQLRAQLQVLLQDAPTYNDLQAQYGLHYGDNNGLSGVAYGVSDTVPGLVFQFGTMFDSTVTDPGQFPLQSVQGPASLLFPDYVGMQTSQIPGFLVDQEGAVQVADAFGTYLINPATPGVLSADDAVTMSPGFPD